LHSSGDIEDGSTKKIPKNGSMYKGAAGDDDDDDDDDDTETCASFQRVRDFSCLQMNDKYMAEVLEDFLFKSLTSEERAQKGSTSEVTSGSLNATNSELGSIFETSFDLTEDRLMRLFRLFDKTNSGTISYDELKLGLAYQGTDLGMSQLGDRAFLSLIGYLDADSSGDITFEEFSEGIRLLLLRSILQQVAKFQRDKDLVVVEVLDYNSSSLKRYILQGVGQVKQAKMSRIVPSQSLVDFFLHPRVEDVSVRWVDITGIKASHIMKMMALKYRLHPLALEDALDSTNQRPKADSYDGHYFIMIPVFNLNHSENREETPSGKEQINHTWRNRLFYAGTKEDDTAYVTFDDEDRKDQKQIRVHMTSIFITKPHWNTVITFNNEQNEEQSWSTLHTELRKSYSRLRQYDGQYLAYSLLDRTVDQIGPIVKTMKGVIKAEKKTLAEHHYNNMNRIHSLKRELKSMSRKFKPFLRLLVHVIEDDSFSPGASIYLRDVLDNLEIYDEDVKHLISLCESTDQEAEKIQAKKMETTLYTLTVISATFLPAQFFTGVWGMNFSNMPELDTTWGYYMFWAIAFSFMFLTIFMLNFGRHSF